jgi:sugar-specific transcriptional regulator TrmB
MEIHKVLEQIGLQKKEADIYLALLELGTASVQSIAQKADLKRPTAYLVLDELERKGLVSVLPQKKALYTAESPEGLIRDLSRKEELIKRFLPDLLALHNAKKEKPQVQLFQGRDGVRQVYDKIFDSGEVWFFGSIREVSLLDPQGLKSFLAKTKESKVRVKEIVADTKEDRAYLSEWRGESPTHEIRLLPADIKYPVSDSAFFGDYAVFFSFHPQTFATVIRSKEISSTLRAFFELAWRGAVIV